MYSNYGKTLYLGDIRNLEQKTALARLAKEAFNLYCKTWIRYEKDIPEQRKILKPILKLIRANNLRAVIAELEHFMDHWEQYKWSAMLGEFDRGITDWDKLSTICQNCMNRKYESQKKTKIAFLLPLM